MNNGYIVPRLPVLGSPRQYGNIKILNRISSLEVAASIQVLKVLNEEKLGDHYLLRTELWDDSDYGGDGKGVEIPVARTVDGLYVGDPEFATSLHRRGIKAELSDTSHSVCSVGFCDREQKWYGWSHRAMCGYGIGDKLFEDDYGDDNTPYSRHGKITIKNLEQARESACRFAESVS